MAFARAGTNGAQLLGPARADGSLGLSESERRAFATPTCKALLGIGDGAILDWLARNAPCEETPPYDSRIAVYVIEPDVNAALLALMLRDLTGDRGPIQQPRFRWFVGPQWRDQLRRELLDEPMLPDPAMLIGQSAQKQAVSQACRELVAERRQSYEQCCEEARRYSEGLDPAYLAEVFGRHGSKEARRYEADVDSELETRNSKLETPRVLLLTSRFTTVLQHSTRDAAETFEQLGWETRVLIECEPFHVMTDLAVMKAIAAFKPHLVFTIDYVRGEGLGIPPDLPFVCWIQDNLPHLMDDRVGATINQREFVIGAWVQQYVERHGYPERQCITIPRLARSPALRAATPDSKHPSIDLVYVSNHSATPEQAFQALLTNYATGSDSQRLLTESARRIAAMYERGESVGQAETSAAVLEEVAGEIGVNLSARSDRAHLATGLFERFNNVLYRQQAVRWVARIARRKNLRFGLYGNGWEAHPEFREFARGPIAYGRDLENLTRRARINLQLEPYFPMSHQRLLDGLMAGGFFLSRTNDPNLPLRVRWRAMIDELDESITTLAEARARLDETRRRELDELHRTLSPILGHPDLVRRSREWHATAEAPQRMRLPPRYLEIAFAGEAELDERIERFIDNEPLRQEIAEAQRRFVAEHFTYEAGLTLLLRRMSERLAEEAAEPARDIVEVAL